MLRLFRVSPREVSRKGAKGFTQRRKGSAKAQRVSRKGFHAKGQRERKEYSTL